MVSINNNSVAIKSYVSGRNNTAKTHQLSVSSFTICKQIVKVKIVFIPFSFVINTKIFVGYI